MSNIDSFYHHYTDMQDLIAKVPGENLRQDLWEKLTWLKCHFDLKGLHDDDLQGLADE